VKIDGGRQRLGETLTHTHTHTHKQTERGERAERQGGAQLNLLSVGESGFDKKS